MLDKYKLYNNIGSHCWHQLQATVEPNIHTLVEDWQYASPTFVLDFWLVGVKLRFFWACPAGIAQSFWAFSVTVKILSRWSVCSPGWSRGIRWALQRTRWQFRHPSAGPPRRWSQRQAGTDGSGLQIKSKTLTFYFIINGESKSFHFGWEKVSTRWSNWCLIFVILWLWRDVQVAI